MTKLSSYYKIRQKTKDKMKSIPPNLGYRKPIVDDKIHHLGFCFQTEGFSEVLL